MVAAHKRGTKMVENFIQDLRYSWRTLWKTPGFTLVAVATLALGIGANSSIFSVINAALLKDLPYPKPDQLVLLSERDVLKEGGGPNIVALANFLDWQSNSRSFPAMALSEKIQFNLGDGERGFLRNRWGAICSWSLFPALGVQPLLGRPFTADEDKHGRGRWRSSATACGSGGLAVRAMFWRQIRLDSENYQIVGVMPRGFAYPERKVDVWVPVQQVLDPARHCAA